MLKQVLTDIPCVGHSEGELHVKTTQTSTRNPAHYESVVADREQHFVSLSPVYH